MSTLTAPPGFVRMASGRVVPAQSSFGVVKKMAKRFLVVLSYYEGDRDATESLASLIADLERTRNHDADILLFRRADSREITPGIQQKLAAKFDKVLLATCRRVDAKGYPFGANEMFCDLLMLMAQIPPFASDYFAFVNLEADAVPTRPGWIGELMAGWNQANAAGKSAIGHIHNDPVPHLNGLAVYAADLFKRVNDRRLMGANPQVCYDIHFANIILPHAVNSPLIYFKYRQPTITPDELFAARKSGVVPAIYHGVKDGSAIAAVRARHIAFTDAPVPAQAPPLFHVVTRESLGVAATIAAEEAAARPVEIPMVMDMPVQGGTFPANAGETITPPDQPIADHVNKIMTDDLRKQLVTPVFEKTDFGVKANTAALNLSQAEINERAQTETKRPNVYTYFSKRGRQSTEEIAVIEAWKKGWTTRGWNPVVLTIRDAAKHDKFDAFSAHVEKLPFVGDHLVIRSRFYRWLALDSAGGGLLVDSDVLPDDIVPGSLPDYPICPFYEAGDLLGVYLSKEESAKWISTITAYDAQPDDLQNGKSHVDDATIIGRQFASDDMGKWMTRIKPDSTGRKSVAMEKFLAAT